MGSKKILVTGASGFIGSNLVKLLVKKNYYVRCFVRKTSNVSEISSYNNIELFYGDIKDGDSIMEATKGVDLMIHLAAATSEKASSYKESYQTNVEGAKYLINSCKKNNVKRLIVVSTQSTKRKRQGNYAKTKAIADKLFINSGLDYTIVKPALVYGKGSKGLFAKIIKLIDKLPVIPIIGSGKYKMQPTYIDDLTAALISIAENDNSIGKVYDLAGGSRLTFNELIKEINNVSQNKKKLIHVPYWICYAGIKMLSLLTKNPPVTTDNLIGLIQETNINLEQAKKDFNYKPISFPDGIKKTIWGDFNDPSKKNIGIIGLGKMGVLHSSIINYLPNAQVVALFDVNKKIKSYVYSMNIKAPFFDNIDKFLESEKMDAVFISVPPAFTYPIIKKCSEKKINFFVEKPLTNNFQRAKLITELAEKNNLETCVGYMYCHIPLIKKAKEIVSSQILGKIDSFDSSAFVTQVLSKKKGWRYNKTTSGGGCVSLHGTHLLYLIYSLFGIPKKISSKLYFPFSEVEDRATSNLTFKDGIKGKMNVSWSEKGYPKLTLNMNITGENGSITLTDESLIINLNKSKQGFKKGKTIIYKSDLDFPEFEIGGDGYFQQDLAFISSLFGKKESLVTVKEASEVQKILQGIYDSYEQKREITLK